MSEWTESERALGSLTVMHPGMLGPLTSVGCDRPTYICN